MRLLQQVLPQIRHMLKDVLVKVGDRDIDLAYDNMPIIMLDKHHRLDYGQI